MIYCLQYDCTRCVAHWLQIPVTSQNDCNYKLILHTTQISDTEHRVKYNHLSGTGRMGSSLLQWLTEAADTWATYWASPMAEVSLCCYEKMKFSSKCTEHHLICQFLLMIKLWRERSLTVSMQEAVPCYSSRSFVKCN